MCMKKIFILFLFVPVLVFAADDHLLINQIQITGGPGMTTNDFVEIYNPTLVDIDLDGHRLVKRTQSGTSDTLIKSWTSQTIIPAGGHYLWANSNFTNIATAPDSTSSATISDDNGIALRQGPSDTGTIIDSVAWGAVSNIFVEGNVFPTNPRANEILVRSQDTNDNSNDFTISSPNTSPPPSATQPEEEIDIDEPEDIDQHREPVYLRTIIISRFLPNPDGPDSGEEWVELYNLGGFEVGLKDWQLDDEPPAKGGIGSTAYKLPEIFIPSHKYAVINLPENVFTLNNTGGDSVRLFAPDDTVIDEVLYTDSAKEERIYKRSADGTFDWENQGEVAGVEVLPVTGSAFPISTDLLFVFLTVICYIYGRLIMKGTKHEQTGIDRYAGC